MTHNLGQKKGTAKGQLLQKNVESIQCLGTCWLRGWRLRPVGSGEIGYRIKLHTYSRQSNLAFDSTTDSRSQTT